jgi:hypothetical protein
MQTYRRFPYILTAVCSILYFAPFLRALRRIGGSGPDVGYQILERKESLLTSLALKG